MAHPSFTSLDQHWRAVAHSAESRRALGALASASPPVAALGAGDLGDLVALVRPGRSRLDPVAADRMLATMVTHQALDPLLGLGVVVALIPGLQALARQMGWGVDGPWAGAESFSGDLVTTAWEVVADWSGRRREFMARALLGAVRKRLSRRAEAWRHEMAGRADGAEVPDKEGASASVAEQLARVLCDAAGTLDRQDLSVVYTTRVLGVPMAEVAQWTGASRQALERRRARAEGRLCA